MAEKKQKCKAYRWNGTGGLKSEET